MSFSEIRTLLDGLSETGSLYLTLSGGEALLRPDFFEIAGYAKSKHFCLTLFTNGSLLDEHKATQIAALSPLAVELSIYGVTPEVHEAITGQSGSFDKLLRAIALLKQRNVRVVLKSVIMEQNFHQALELEEFSSRLGADDYRFTLEIAPKNDGSKSVQRYQIDEGKVRAIIHKHAGSGERKKHEYWDNPLEKPVCGTGTIGCYISPYGVVYPCSQLLIPMGDVREKSFGEIWFGPSQLREELSLLKTYADMPECRGCAYVRACKKCIGLAYLETKDLKKCYNNLKCISRADYEVSLEQEAG